MVHSIMGSAGGRQTDNTEQNCPAQDTAGDHKTRIALCDELYKRFNPTFRNPHWIRVRLRYWRKKYAWLLVVGGARVVKRVLDITAAALLLVVLMPLFVLVGILIKATDGGPILFWQTRVGQYGREFPFPKFRSMVTNAEERKKELLANSDHDDSVTFKMKKDPRITWIGRLIRKTSVDEMPQLWCVLKGEMTLVGPRPPVPQEVADYTLADRRRLDVKPGLTCFWQVSGRADLPFDKQVELDVAYIESQSIWTDIKLLFRTVPAVLFGRGAY